jgi:hypothetical protein
LYINDLPKITTKNTKFIVYADDTSTLVTNPSANDFKINLNKVFVDMNKWFEANFLSFNFKKLSTCNLGLKISKKLM